MLNFKRLAEYMARGVVLERTVLDETLEEHDRRFHGGMFDESKMTCGRRDEEAEKDREDDCRVECRNGYRVDCTEEKIAEIASVLEWLKGAMPVCRVSGDEFGPDGRKLTEKIPEYFERAYGGVAESPEFGKISLDIEGVQDDIAHGIGRVKAAAFAAVHDIIENGISYNKAKNWKGRGWTTAVVAAPILIGDEPYVGEVVLKEIPRRVGLYLHEVEAQRNVEVIGSEEDSEKEHRHSRLVIGRLAEACL